jgi:hypothetical protein
MEPKTEHKEVLRGLLKKNPHLVHDALTLGVRLGSAAERELRVSGLYGVIDEIYEAIQAEPEPYISLLIEPLPSDEVLDARYRCVAEWFRHASFQDVAPYIGKRLHLIVLRPLDYLGRDGKRDVFTCFCRICPDGQIVVADFKGVADWHGSGIAIPGEIVREGLDLNEVDRMARLGGASISPRREE